MTLDYELTERDVDLSLLSEKEKVEVVDGATDRQDGLMNALRIVLPRMDEGHLEKFVNRDGEVRLSRNDLYTAFLATEESTALKQSMQDFLHQLDVKVLSPLEKEGNALHVKNADYLKDMATQVYYRNVLAITGERFIRVDARGDRIMSPAEYLEKLAECKDEKEKKKLNESIVRPVKLKTIMGWREIQADYHLAPLLQRISSAGFISGQSCSGLLSDHPNYRYVSDDKWGRYVKGECINYNKQGSSAYITFWKPEAAMKGDACHVNDQIEVDAIRCLAHEQGWVVKDTEVFYRPSLHLTLPQTYDGCGKREILHEANERTDKLYPGLKGADFLQWLEKRTPIEMEVENEHGGVVRWTDELLSRQWEKLTAALEMHREQRKVAERKEQLQKDMARISDIVIYVGGDGYWRMRCKIDGVQQLSERVSDHQMGLVEKVGAAAVAADVYSIKLRGTIGQDSGRKR